jgi:hypothetical protein
MADGQYTLECDPLVLAERVKRLEHAVDRLSAAEMGLRNAMQVLAYQCAGGFSETAPNQAHRCEELHKGIVDTWGDIHAASVEMGRSY